MSGFIAFCAVRTMLQALQQGGKGAAGLEHLLPSMLVNKSSQSDRQQISHDIIHLHVGRQSWHLAAKWLDWRQHKICSWAGMIGFHAGALAVGAAANHLAISSVPCCITHCGCELHLLASSAGTGA